MATSDTYFYRLLYPRQTCMVTSSHEGKSNVNVVDWVMPVSIKPPMVAISINKNGLTYDLISESKEFALAILPESMRDTVASCAKSSGKFIDKFEEFSIATMKAQIIKAPLIHGALGQMECRVMQMFDAGEHSVIVGEVVEIHFPDDEKSTQAPLFNRGRGGYFGFQKEWLEMKVPREEERNGKPEEEKKADRKEDKSEEKKAEKKDENKTDEKAEKKDEKKTDEKAEKKEQEK